MSCFAERCMEVPVCTALFVEFSKRKKDACALKAHIRTKAAVVEDIVATSLGLYLYVDGAESVVKEIACKN